jgi:hypothetical protein
MYIIPVFFRPCVNRICVFHSFDVCLSAAQVYRDRDQFASLVREVAAPDVGRMGIEILSFTIKGIQTTTSQEPYMFAQAMKLMSRPMAQ